MLKYISSRDINIFTKIQNRTKMMYLDYNDFKKSIIFINNLSNEYRKRREIELQLWSQISLFFYARYNVYYYLKLFCNFFNSLSYVFSNLLIIILNYIYILK